MIHYEDLAKVGLKNDSLTTADKLQVSEDGNYTVHGEGMFDDLMEAVTKHLDSQYKLGRIQGAEYAQVYEASLNSAINGSVAFLTQKPDPDLLAMQIAEIKTKIDLSIAEVKVKAATVRKIDQDIAQSKAQVKLINAQVTLTGAQKTKTDNESRLIGVQIEVAYAQLVKIWAEKNLLEEKLVSEYAQTRSGVAAGDSLLGSQMNLYEEQAKGFYWNAKRNWAKLTVDAASVDASQGEGFTDALSNSAGDRGSARPNQGGG